MKELLAIHTKESDEVITVKVSTAYKYSMIHC